MLNVARNVLDFRLHRRRHRLHLLHHRFLRSMSFLDDYLLYVTIHVVFAAAVVVVVVVVEEVEDWFVLLTISIDVDELDHVS